MRLQSRMSRTNERLEGASAIGRLRSSSIVQSMTWTFDAGWVRRGAGREYW